jgi:hypothetical protein
MRRFVRIIGLGGADVACRHTKSTIAMLTVIVCPWPRNKCPGGMLHSCGKAASDLREPARKNCPGPGPPSEDLHLSCDHQPSFRQFPDVSIRVDGYTII